MSDDRRIDDHGAAALDHEAGNAVARHDRVADHDVRVWSRGDPDVRVDHARIADHRPDTSVGRRYQYPVRETTPHRRVFDVEHPAAAIVHDAACGAFEIIGDQAVLDVDRRARPDTGQVDADAAIVGALKRQIPEIDSLHPVVWLEGIESHEDRGSTVIENRADLFVAIDGDRFRDRHETKAARIEAVDLPEFFRFRECAAKALARGCPAASVAIIAHAGNEGPRGRLSLGSTCDEGRHCRGGDEAKRAEFYHGQSPQLMIIRDLDRGSAGDIPEIAEFFSGLGLTGEMICLGAGASSSPRHLPWTLPLDAPL